MFHKHQNQHIRMTLKAGVIAAENSALQSQEGTKIKNKYIEKEKVHFNLYKYFTILQFLLILWLVNTDLVSII